MRGLGSERPRAVRGLTWDAMNNVRVSDHPSRTLEIVAIAITVGGLLFTFLPLALWWSSIPDTIPTHFDLYGQPNAYGSKAALLIYPGVALGITLLFQALCHYPWLFNYPVRITEENAMRQYRRGRLLLRWVNALVWLLGGIQWQAVQVARGAATSLGTAYMLGAFIILALMSCRDHRAGHYLGAAR